jgi:M6 family metalloprotease-like protein
MSIPFNGKRFTFHQPDGTRLDVRGWGDQHQAVFETLDGYTLVRDPQSGFYAYAEVSPDGETLRSTGVPAARVRSGAALGLQPGTRLAPAAQRRRALGPGRHLPGKRRWETRRENALRVRREARRMAGIALAPPSRATVGDYVGLVLLVQFPDVPGAIPARDVEDFCNQPGYSGFGNNGSVFDYFRDTSHGKLRYTNLVAGYYTAANPRSYYTNPAVPQPVRTFELITEAVSHFLGQGFDFSQLTADSQGFIYALSVFYAGTRVNNWAEGLWPHSYRLDSPISVGPGRRLQDYQITDMGGELTLATFCHENGHMVCDFPDLYDYGYESSGVGDYCLMCTSGPSERNPTEVCAYLKYQAGWASRVTPLTSGMSVVAPSSGNEFFLYAKDDTEYFIIENRFRAGRDAHLPDSGLAIWHVDENGSNNDEQMTPSRHYECSLKQADNQLELEKNVNQGDVGDLFSSASGAGFGEATTPPSRWWDGTSSGLSISAISAPGTQMTFQTAAGTGSLTTDGKSTPNVPIPDFDEAGVSDVIVLAASGGGPALIESVQVTVDIDHPYRGDLRVVLRAPSGTAAVLHDRQGGSEDHLKKTFDATTTPALNAFAGQPAAGAWTLGVQDLARADTGALRAWTIAVKARAGAGPQEPLELGEAPGVRIPDSDPDGIVRAVHCAAGGTLSEARVDLDIAHTYIRDLVVTLESPRGTRVDLHHRSGGSTDNIIRTFDEDDTPGLTALRGEPVTGDWKLRVSDHEAADVGKLNRWALHLFRQ